jgi:hypothetical protein
LSQGLAERHADTYLPRSSLVNALQLVNRQQDSVTENAHVQDRLAKVRASRKTIVRYIQLVENDPDGEYVGMLLSTNENLLNAQKLYERMSKPAENDSDSDEADAKAIADRLGNVSVSDVLSSRQSPPSPPPPVSKAPPGVHPDLAGLWFDDRDGPAMTSTSLAKPIEPRHAGDEDARGLSLSGSGHLSDYSDYDSSSDGEIRAGTPPTSASASAEGSRAYRRYLASVDDDGRESISGGREGLLRNGGEEEEDDDPFADPSDVGTPGIIEKKRLSW